MRWTCMTAAVAMALAGLMVACKPIPGSDDKTQTDATADPPPTADRWVATGYGSMELVESTPPAGMPPPPAAPQAGATPAVNAAPASAATRPFEFDADLAPKPAAAECRFPVLPPASGYRLYAAGSYGGRDAGFHIDRSGSEATLMDVVVNQRDAPVALMLGSYEPTVWNIGWSRGTRIVAVLVGGYHRQVVTGLPADVPVIVSTYDDKGPCGYFYVTAEKAAILPPIAQRAFGRRIDMVYPAEKGRVVVGEPLGAGATLVTDRNARPAADFQVAESLAGGKAGLEHAVRRGWLREATRADADAWLAAVARQPSADVPPIAGGRPPGRIRMHNGYVVLQAFELPPGLHGAHSATFFVPEGGPRPTGDLGHSALYDFNTMTCAGAVCGMH